jgi:hypothetical protein
MSNSQHSVSPEQLTANRANAIKSTGPRTPEGKARSSHNARKYRFTASTFAVVRLEDVQEVARLKDDLLALYRPINSQELLALERMALAQHAILRGARLESGLFTICLNESFDNTGQPIRLMNKTVAGDGDIQITQAQNRRLSCQSNSWSLLMRYQAQAERHYRRAVEEFERLKALREVLANEPIFEGILEAQPEQKEPPYTPFQTDPFPPENPAPPPDPPASVSEARPPESLPNPEIAPRGM